MTDQRLNLIFYPFQLFNTFIHEFSHGFIALLTGGGFRYMRVHRNREGVAAIRGGNLGIIATAGYLGSVLASGLFIQLPTAQVMLTSYTSSPASPPRSGLSSGS